MKIENKIWARLISVIWIGSIVAVIFYSLIPRVEFPVGFWQVDKLCHFFSYAWLSALPMVAYSDIKFASTASFSMIILGVLMEILQLYVPGRDFSVADIVMNTLGVILGIYGGSYLRRFLLSHRSFRLFQNIN